MSKVKISKNLKRSVSDIDKKLLELEHVEEIVKKNNLQSTIFNVSKRYPFMGSVMQCMNIFYTHMLPTAGVSYNNDLKRWDMYINPFFFCRKLSPEQREAVLLHEIYHILHKHPIRLPMLKIPERERRLMNVAMDMAINQYIPNLPDGCSACHNNDIQCTNPMCPGKAIRVEDFKKQYKDLDFKENCTAEEYFQLLLNIEREKEDEESNGDGNSKSNNKSVSVKNADTLDNHGWDDSADEKDMLDSTEELVKRAMIKSSTSYTNLPNSIKELLEEIDARRAELNYKALILLAMKSSLPSNTREYSWSRKSRRFGSKAPGTRNGKQPRLEIFLDTSGSISVEEANEFLEIVDEFLKVGAKECNLNLFHTSNYLTRKYKRKDGIKREDFENGGTNLEDSLKRIAKIRPDLSIFLTDGYYSDVDVESMVGVNNKFPKVIFIINQSGSTNHPFKDRDWAITIKIP